MSLKTTIKQLLPNSWILKRQRMKTAIQLRKDVHMDRRRFAKAYAAPACVSQTQMESLLIFFVHQIEKGFSFDEYQFGRGKGALRNIADLSARLRIVDANWRNNPVYRDAVLALGEYLRRHLSAGHDTTYMTSLFDAEMLNDIERASKRNYPCIELSKNDKLDNADVPFHELVERRHAIRSYSEQPVTRAELEEAITLSLRTPSVCNRQPARIRIFTDAKQISNALKIQGGFGGYDTPPVLMLVTADLQAFMGSNERNEGYVDGGLFSMSLLYALESCGLAACPLNTMFSQEMDEKTRELLHIPENEVFIMYISVGHFRETSRICRSQRFGLDRILMN